MEHKQEIMNNPEYIENFAIMHNKFDAIIERPNVIKAYKDAFVTSAEEILTCFNIKKQENEKNIGVQLDFSVQSVLDYIGTEKKTFQEILDFSKLSTKELNAILFELELSGLVTKLANNSYIMS